MVRGRTVYHRRMPPDSDFDAYLAGRPPGQQRHLRELRARVLEFVPHAVDAISYGLPALNRSQP